MTVIVSIIGGTHVVLGLFMIAWELRARESPWLVYHGVMFLAIGVSLILGFAFPLRGTATTYGIMGSLALVAAWSGRKGILLMREEGMAGSTSSESPE
jgi:ABC-type transport system involved in cytochrome c biogenesis permease subunit